MPGATSSDRAAGIGCADAPDAGCGISEIYSSDLTGEMSGCGCGWSSTRGEGFPQGWGTMVCSLCVAFSLCARAHLL